MRAAIQSEGVELEGYRMDVDDRLDAPGALDARFRAVATEYGPALVRLSRGYEADAGRQQDLVQEILVAVWSALPGFEGRASVRTFVYRVAHNVAVTHVLKARRDRLARAVPVDDADVQALVRNAALEAESRDTVARLAALIRGLRPIDAQLILLALEGLEHAEIAEITGLSRDHVAVKLHRVRALLARALANQEGDRHDRT